MKKVVSSILTVTTLLTISAIVYAKDIKFHDGVYRGEDWEFDFGKPKNNIITIIPQDRPEAKVYGNGYVDRVEDYEKPYEIILLDN